MSPTARLPGTGSAQAEAHEERHGTEGARRREDLEQEVVGVATAMNPLVQANAELVLVVDRPPPDQRSLRRHMQDRKSTRLNSSHSQISYAVFCLKKKKSAYHTRCRGEGACRHYHYCRTLVQY